MPRLSHIVTYTDVLVIEHMKLTETECLSRTELMSGIFPGQHLVTVLICAYTQDQGFPLAVIFYLSTSRGDCVSLYIDCWAREC